MSEQTQRNAVRRWRGVRLVAVVVTALVAVAGPIAGVGVVASAPATDDTRTITYGETVSGAVDSVDPIRSNPTKNSHSGDWYYEPVSFEGEAGDVIDVRVFAPTDTSLILVGPDGQRITWNEDGRDGNNSQILHRLEENGTYTIQVTSHFPEDTFEYLLSLDRRETTQSSSIAPGETVVGTVDETNDESVRFNGRYEEITIDGTAGQEVELTHSSTVDSALYLEEPGGLIVAEDVAPYAGQDATLSHRFEQDGTYTVIVASGDPDGEFSYELTAKAVTEDEQTDAERNESNDETTDSSTDDGSNHHAGTGLDGSAEANLRILDAGLNQTSTTLGSSVEYTVTVANYGEESGTFDRPVLVDGQATTRVNETVGPYRLRTVTVSMTPNRTGQFEVALGDESPETLTVVPPTTAAGNTVAVSNDTQMGFEANTSAGDAVEFVFDTPRTDATLQSVSVESAEAGTLWLEAVQTRNLTAGGPPAEGVSVVNGYVLRPSLQSGGNTTESPIRNGTVTIAVDRASLGDTAEANVVLYRYDEATDDWIPLRTTRVGSNDDTVTYRAQTTQFSEVAVGTVDPISTTGSLSKTAIGDDETVTVRATVRNNGSAEIERTVPITVDGDTVTERSVSVPAGGEQTVTASISPAAGTHDIGVGGVSVGTLTVEAVSTDGEQTQGQATTEATTGGSGAGFGVLLALLAVTLALLTVRRRRG